MLSSQGTIGKPQYLGISMIRSRGLIVTPELLLLLALTAPSVLSKQYQQFTLTYLVPLARRGQPKVQIVMATKK